MYSLATGLGDIAVRDILDDTRQLITGPPCLKCRREALAECDGIAGHPAKNTLCDPAMGPRMQGEKCMHQRWVFHRRDLTASRCRLDFSRCPGHAGRIALARPCFAPHFVKTIIAVLKLVCARCMRQPANHAGPGSCQPCGRPFESVAFVDGLMVMRSPVASYKMDAAAVLGVLGSIDAAAVGVTPQLRSLVLTEIEVLPTRYRPYTQAGARCLTNPLTGLYANVIEANKAVAKGANPLAHIDLQKAVNCLFDAAHSSKNGATSLVTCIGKKEGLIRQDMLGKRVGESARTVM